MTPGMATSLLFSVNISAASCAVFELRAQSNRSLYPARAQRERRFQPSRMRLNSRPQILQHVPKSIDRIRMIPLSLRIPLLATTRRIQHKPNRVLAPIPHNIVGQDDHIVDARGQGGALANGCGDLAAHGLECGEAWVAAAAAGGDGVVCCFCEEVGEGVGAEFVALVGRVEHVACVVGVG